KNLRPCAYASRKLTKTEMAYCVRELEALAVVWAVEKFQDYLLPHKFTVLTDHSSLQWLMKQDVPKGRLLNWAYKLRLFDFDIIYRQGSSKPCADALSRLVSTVTVESKRESEVLTTSTVLRQSVGARVPFYHKKIQSEEHFYNMVKPREGKLTLVAQMGGPALEEKNKIQTLFFPNQPQWKAKILADTHFGPIC